MKGLLFFLAFFVCVFASFVFGVGGDMGIGTDPKADGSAEHPWLIEGFDDFAVFAVDPNYWGAEVNTKLMADIDLDPNLPGRETYNTAVIASGVEGHYGFEGDEYRGNFDGNGHVIRNLTIHASGGNNDYLGLFGFLRNYNSPKDNVLIKDLGLENVDINGGDGCNNVGSICGWKNHGIIKNCYSTGSVKGGTDSVSVGGLCGVSYRGAIEKCYSTCNVLGYNSVGGLCGYNSGSNALITKCYATGAVSGRYHVGGLCGLNATSIDYSMIDSYATGAVTGLPKAGAIGGLCGDIYSGSLLNCYATGAVSCGDDSGGLGGLCGTARDVHSKIVSCYAEGDVISGNNSNYLGGLCGDGYPINCYATGSVTAGDGCTVIGGLTGKGEPVNCYAEGNIEAGDSAVDVGGLCGIGEGYNCYSTGNVTVGGGSVNIGGSFGTIDGDTEFCYANCTVTAGDKSNKVGGLCGFLDTLWDIKNCYAIADVSGGDESVGIGGLCGSTYKSLGNHHGEIRSSYARGTVSGGIDCQRLGGLCGNNTADVINCYSRVTVSGGDGSIDIAGFCGRNENGNVSFCYSTGPVEVGTGSINVAGFCGYNRPSTGGSIISDCFWDRDTSGMSTGYNCESSRFVTCDEWINNLEGKTTSEMKSLLTFTGAGWDFANEWSFGVQLAAGGYPYLAWQATLTGEGTENDPYLINDADDFEKFASSEGHWLLNRHAKLNCDLDLGCTTYTTAVISPDFASETYELEGVAYSGVFDGGGHVIEGLEIDTMGLENKYLGFFGSVGWGGVIKNLSINGVSISGGSNYIGGLCGANKGEISRCSVSGTITVERANSIGGLCGTNNYENIVNCSTDVKITSSDYAGTVGGICGSNVRGSMVKCFAVGDLLCSETSERIGGVCGNLGSGSIINCSASGNVTGYRGLGGLCGYGYTNYKTGMISGCYAKGAVEGVLELGGLCGNNMGITVVNCYSTGDVIGLRDFASGQGGLCGENSNGEIINCYSTGKVIDRSNSIFTKGLCGRETVIEGSFWDVESSGVGSAGDDNYGAVGTTTDQMQAVSTFQDAGWDFVGESVNGDEDVWRLCVDGSGYPRLAWEYARVGDFVCGDGVDMDDFAYFAGEYGTYGDIDRADLDGDGVVGVSDLAVFCSHWLDD